MKRVLITALALSMVGGINLLAQPVPFDGEEDPCPDPIVVVQPGPCPGYMDKYWGCVAAALFRPLNCHIDGDSVSECGPVGESTDVTWTCDTFISE